jgi:hypothetical protein
MLRGGLVGLLRAVSAKAVRAEELEEVTRVKLCSIAESGAWGGACSWLSAASTASASLSRAGMPRRTSRPPMLGGTRGEERSVHSMGSLMHQPGGCSTSMYRLPS